MAAKRFTFTLYLDDAIPEEVDLAQEIDALTGNRARTAWVRRMLLRSIAGPSDQPHFAQKPSRSSRKPVPRRAARPAAKSSAKASVKSAISAVAALPSARSPAFHGESTVAQEAAPRPPAPPAASSQAVRALPPDPVTESPDHEMSDTEQPRTTNRYDALFT